MKKFIQIIIVCFFFTHIYSQNSFVKSYDSYTHSIYGMCKVDASTFALTGPANDSAGGNWDFILMKFNVDGNIIFSKKINDSLFWNESTDILSVSDGGFLVTVRSGSPLYYPEIVRVDSNGVFLWAKKFASNKNLELYSSLECQNGDFVFGGTKEGILGTEAIIVRTNYSGDTLWTKKIGVPGYGTEVVSDIIETNNQNLLAYGNTSTGAGNIFVAKLNAFGDTIWTRTYGTPNQDYSSNIIRTSNGAFYLNGTTNFSAGKRGGFIIKIDSLGSIVWSTVLGTNYKFFSNKIAELSNKDLLLAGNVTSINGGQSDGLLCVTDSMGIFKFATKYGDSVYEELRDVVLMNDSTCVAAGSIIHNAVSHSNTLLIEQNVNNFYGCINSTLLLNDTTVTFQESHGLSLYQNAFQVLQHFFTTENMPLIDSNLCMNITVSDFERNHDNGIQIYPNPFSSQFTITFNQEQINSKVKILDEIGKEIKAINFNGKQVVLKNDNMSQGVYFIQLTLNNKEVIYKKLILQ